MRVEDVLKATTIRQQYEGIKHKSLLFEKVLEEEKNKLKANEEHITQLHIDAMNILGGRRDDKMGAYKRISTGRSER